jgi:uncharacterized protein YcbX
MKLAGIDPHPRIVRLHVSELWRYPVKSMAGERLDRAEVRLDGIAGDRLVLVQDAHGGVVTARTRHRLLGHRGTIGSDGEPLVDGRPWNSPGVAAIVEEATGAGARLVRAPAQARFDVLPLLVATDGAIAAFGSDRRRLRPNIVIGGVPGLEERSWEGLRLRIGSAVIGLDDLRARCVTTTFDPDTLEQDPRVLRRIYAEFGGTLALNARVLDEGTIAVGDPVELLR